MAWMVAPGTDIDRVIQRVITRSAISAARLSGHTAGLAQHEDYGAGEPDEQVVDSGLTGQRVLVGPGRA